MENPPPQIYDQPTAPSHTSPPLHQQDPLEDILPLGPRSLDDEIHLGLNSTINDLKKTACFIDALRGATLEESNMQQGDIDRLRATKPDPCLDITDKHFDKAFGLFMSTTNTSQANYNAIRSRMLKCYPNDPFLSFDQMKRHVQQLSGVVPIFHDMCPDTCIGFTGPFLGHDSCPMCGKDRYRPGTQEPC